MLFDKPKHQLCYIPKSKMKKEETNDKKTNKSESPNTESNETKYLDASVLTTLQIMWMEDFIRKYDDAIDSVYEPT